LFFSFPLRVSTRTVQRKIWNTLEVTGPSMAAVIPDMVNLGAVDSDFAAIFE
jgi:hypothetical protein